MGVEGAPARRRRRAEGDEPGAPLQDRLPHGPADHPVEVQGHGGAPQRPGAHHEVAADQGVAQSAVGVDRDRRADRRADGEQDGRGDHGPPGPGGDAGDDQRHHRRRDDECGPAEPAAARGGRVRAQRRGRRRAGLAEDHRRDPLGQPSRRGRQQGAVLGALGAAPDEQTGRHRVDARGTGQPHPQRLDELDAGQPALLQRDRPGGEHPAADPQRAARLTVEPEPAPRLRVDQERQHRPGQQDPDHDQHDPHGGRDRPQQPAQRPVDEREDHGQHRDPEQRGGGGEHAVAQPARVQLGDAAVGGAGGRAARGAHPVEQERAQPVRLHPLDRPQPQRRLPAPALLARPDPEGDQAERAEDRAGGHVDGPDAPDRQAARPPDDHPGPQLHPVGRDPVARAPPAGVGGGDGEADHRQRDRERPQRDRPGELGRTHRDGDHGRRAEDRDGHRRQHARDRHAARVQPGPAGRVGLEADAPGQLGDPTGTGRRAGPHRPAPPPRRPTVVPPSVASTSSTAHSDVPTARGRVAGCDRPEPVRVRAGGR
ncbi:hypothetical protein GCM10023215_24300 [Pseudonocardia yuanmonensis]|uniref:Uncharacterized protein n=1 Tax=Pseudonocardia yuanmonensis TaxID=1095914 RepID=A0ABP8WHC1_9PSEU